MTHETSAFILIPVWPISLIPFNSLMQIASPVSADGYTSEAELEHASEILISRIRCSAG